MRSVETSSPTSPVYYALGHKLVEPRRYLDSNQTRQEPVIRILTVRKLSALAPSVLHVPVTLSCVIHPPAFKDEDRMEAMLGEILTSNIAVWKEFQCNIAGGNIAGKPNQWIDVT